jgi:hypothetical protein
MAKPMPVLPVGSINEPPGLVFFLPRYHALAYAVFDAAALGVWFSSLANTVAFTSLVNLFIWTRVFFRLFQGWFC